MNPITPPASSPAKRKRSHMEPDSPVTPTRPRLQIPSPRQDLPSSALSPRTQVAGRFRNLSIQKEESRPVPLHAPSTYDIPSQQRSHKESSEGFNGRCLGTVISPQDPSADALLRQLSGNQRHLLATSSPAPARNYPPVPPPAQINPSTIPATLPLHPLTTTSQAAIPPLLDLSASPPPSRGTPTSKRTKSPSPSNKAAKTASSPSPTSKRARSPPPPPTSIDPDEDDMTGFNGIGYRPTPAQAYARTQKRRQQVKEWKVREEREMRGRRAERRRGGVGQGEVKGARNEVRSGVGKGAGNEIGKGGPGDVEGERKVRFVGVVG